LKHEREKRREEKISEEKRKWRGSERHWKGQEIIFPVFKVPRQCPLFLLVQLHLREDKL
jgi:hypothetical protein